MVVDRVRDNLRVVHAQFAFLQFVLQISFRKGIRFNMLIINNFVIDAINYTCENLRIFQTTTIYAVFSIPEYLYRKILISMICLFPKYYSQKENNLCRLMYYNVYE